MYRFVRSLKAVATSSAALRPARRLAGAAAAPARAALASTSASSAARLLAAQPARGMAKAAAKPAAKGAKKDDKAKAGAAADGGLNMEPLAVLKGQQPPAVQPDSAYPEWLFSIDQPLPTLAELRKRDFESLPDRDRQRMLKLTNRLLIKTHNALKKKK